VQELCNYFCPGGGGSMPCIEQSHKIGKENHTFYHCGPFEGGTGSRDPDYSGDGYVANWYSASGIGNNSFRGCSEPCCPDAETCAHGR
jgi:hypothetical protein